MLLYVVLCDALDAFDALLLALIEDDRWFPGTTRRKLNYFFSVKTWDWEQNKAFSHKTLPEDCRQVRSCAVSIFKIKISLIFLQKPSLDLEWVGEVLGHFALALWLDVGWFVLFFSQCYINRCARNWGVWAKQAEWWQWSEVGNIARRNGGGCSSYSVWSAVVGTVGIVGKGTVGVVTV